MGCIGHILWHPPWTWQEAWLLATILRTGVSAGDSRRLQLRYLGWGQLCSPDPCRLTCRSRYFPYLMPVLSSCRTVCRMSLIRIGCRSSSSLSDAPVPMSPGLSWLVGSVAATWSWGDHLRIDLKHDRG